MNGQLSFETTAIDVTKLVSFSLAPVQSRWRTSGINPQYGTSLGILEIKGVRAYGVVMLMDSGKVQVFDPQSLLPETA